MPSDNAIVFSTEVDESGLKKGLSAIGDVAQKGCDLAVKAIGAVSAALGAGMTAAFKYGSEFQESMAKVSTLFGDVDVGVDHLEGRVLELSNSTGLAASEINQAMYSALSAGIPVTEDMGAATDFVAKCAQLAKAGFTDVDSAVGATAKVLNAYGMSVEETDRVQKIMMQTQNKGITTVDELSASLAQVTPTAAAMGVSFEQVGAGLATMTAQGTPTAQATTQLNGMFAEL